MLLVNLKAIGIWVKCWLISIKVLLFLHFFKATTCLLEKVDIILSKSSQDEIRSDILPMIFNVLDSNSIQGQVKYSSNLVKDNTITVQYLTLYNINLDYCHLIGRVRVT